MKKLMMLVLICASVLTYNQSYATSGSIIFPGSKSSKSTKTQTATKTQNHVRKNNKRQHGYNYYKYANNRGYLKVMGKAISGR